MKKLSIIFLMVILLLTACNSTSKEKEATLGEVLESSETLNSDIEKIMEFSTIDGYTDLQGGWSDGKYFYQSVIKHNGDDESNNEVLIVKYDLEKKEEVQRSEPMKLDHINDITYNSKEGYFVVAHNTPNYKTISFIDPETLTIKESKNIKNSIYGITYNEKKDCYVIGISGGYTWAIVDTDFEEIDVFDGTPSVEGYTKQGISSDDDYVYFLYHNFSKMAVFDWDGNFVTLINLSKLRGEPQNVSVVDGSIYLGSDKGMFKISKLYVKE